MHNRSEKDNVGQGRTGMERSWRSRIIVKLNRTGQSCRLGQARLDWQEWIGRVWAKQDTQNMTGQSRIGRIGLGRKDRREQIRERESMGGG